MKALIKIQNELKAPKGQTNAFGKYKYRSCEDILEALKPLLAANESLLTISDCIVDVCGHLFVKSTATFLCGDFSLSVDGFAKHALVKKGMDDSQITGASSSYSRKYALNGLFLIDDTKDADTLPPPPAEKVLKAASDTTFDNYFKAIAEGQKDKKGTLITVEYLRARHTLNSAQESSLLDLNLD
jgi:hypothetical protein